MNSFKIARDSRLPLYQKLRDEIAARIADGEWLPDTSIPTESELAKSYNVALGTVRKAVDALVHEGLLDRQQGRGTFVRRPDFTSSFFRFFRQKSADTRVQIPESRIISRELVKAPEEIAGPLTLNNDSGVIHLGRLRVVNQQTLFREHIWLPQIPFEPLMNIPLEEFGNLLYPFYEQQCGQRIAKAEETLTISSADAETAEVLGLKTGDPIVVIERIARGYDGQPLEYRISRGRADTFRYRIDIV